MPSNGSQGFTIPWLGPTGFDSSGLAAPRELSTAPVDGSGCGPPLRPPPPKLNFLPGKRIKIMARAISKWNMENIPASLPPSSPLPYIFALKHTSAVSPLTRLCPSLGVEIDFP